VLLVGCGGVDLNCERYGWWTLQGGPTVELAMWNNIDDGREATEASIDMGGRMKSTKEPANRKWQRDDTRQALFGRSRAFRIWRRGTYPSSRFKV